MGESETKIAFRLIFIPWRKWLGGVSGVVFLFVASLAIAGSLGLSEELLSHIEKKYGARALDRVLDWRELVSSYKGEPERKKLELVNDFFNQVRFLDDIVHWKKEDYWATPVETLATNGGDCEDFSIAKYFTLKEMGVPVKRMTLTYVKATTLNKAHMVVTYYPTPGAEPLVLDNLDREIKPASERGDLIPVYSFNGEGLWLSKERGRGERIGSSNRMILWKNLGLRMEKEGLVR